MRANQNFNKCKKSPSEKFCKNSFDKFLNNRLPNSAISWDCVEQKDEPKKFIQDKVESVALHYGYLNGLYLVTFWKPIDSFTKVKTIIQNKLLTYIQATQGLTNAPSKLIYECGRQICKMTKVHIILERK